MAGLVVVAEKVKDPGSPEGLHFGADERHILATPPRDKTRSIKDLMPNSVEMAASEKSTPSPSA